MKTLRKSIFWIHLVCGLIAGLFIALMSATGIAIAFEHEILDWIDNDVSTAHAPPGATTLDLETLEGRIREQFPAFRPSRLVIPRDPDDAYRFFMGREGSLYVDPYTGEAREPRSTTAHEVLHTLEMVHRWLGMEGENPFVGKMINGTANLAFLVLCLTGLYLWFPRKWIWRAVRQVIWFRKTTRSKARDFNWHNVLGFWNLPVLIVLAGTAVVISFGWAHDLVFRAVGEAPPKFRDFRMMLVTPPEVEARSHGTPLFSIDDAFDVTKHRHPDWVELWYRYPHPVEDPETPHAPIDLNCIGPAMFSTAGMTMLKLDPYTGEELQAVAFQDRSAGLKTRVWIRFLHTGEAFGLIGKIVATLASAASLILVYTGFALSWRRFFG